MSKNGKSFAGRKVNALAEGLSCAMSFIPEGFIYYDQLQDKFENELCFTCWPTQHNSLQTARENSCTQLI